MTARDMIISPGKYRVRSHDYEMLAEAGAFGGARTELIGGEVIIMSPQYRPHGMVKMGLYDALRDALRDRNSSLRPVVEFTLALAPDSMPDPDLMLTNEPRGPKAVPLASVALVIEVADTTLDDDLGAKLRLYAEHGVPEYWVADVNARVIHQMWAPMGERYGETREVGFGASVTAATLADVTIATDEL